MDTLPLVLGSGCLGTRCACDCPGSPGEGSRGCWGSAVWEFLGPLLPLAPDSADFVGSPLSPKHHWAVAQEGRDRRRVASCGHLHACPVPAATRWPWMLGFMP